MHNASVRLTLHVLNFLSVQSAIRLTHAQALWTQHSRCMLQAPVATVFQVVLQDGHATPLELNSACRHISEHLRNVYNLSHS